MTSPDAPLMGSRYTQPDEYFRFLQRTLAGAGRRVAEADRFQLTELMRLREHLDEAIEFAIAGLRNDSEAPASWSDIGRAMHMATLPPDAPEPILDDPEAESRRRKGLAANARRKFGDVDGARRSGGQPGHWR